MKINLFRRLLPKPVSNNGSQLRDHQANERTFLSWTRMGLAFAAMALALGRLDLIDRILHPQKSARPLSSAPSAWHHENRVTGENQQQQDPESYQQASLRWSGEDMDASRLCQAISVWSSGYGIWRYISVRRVLLQGRYVPAIWGPILITCGSLSAFTIHTPRG